VPVPAGGDGWAPDYATVPELAAFVRVGDDADETQMGLALAAASRAIDRATRRQFGVVDEAEARTYTAWYCWRRERWVVPIDDLMSDTDLAVAFDTGGDESYGDEVDSYSLRPSNAAAEDRPWEELVVLPGSSVTPTDTDNAVQVTAVWGWAGVPNAVKEACLLQASRLLSRRDSPFGVAGSPQAGSEIRLLAKVDPDVAVALAPYKRCSRAVFA
jgi:hypothetical protein